MSKGILVVVGLGRLIVEISEMRGECSRRVMSFIMIQVDIFNIIMENSRARQMLKSKRE